MQVAAEAPGLDIAVDARRAVPACRCRARDPPDVGCHRLPVDSHFAVSGHARDARLQDAGRSVTSFRNSVPPRAAAIRLSRAAHSRSAGMTAGAAPKSSRSSRDGSAAAQSTRCENAGCVGSPARAGSRATDSTFRPAWSQQQDAALGESRAAHEVLLRAMAADRPTSSRAGQDGPEAAGAEIRSTTVIVSGMAGLKKGIQLRPVTHRPSDDGASGRRTAQIRHRATYYDSSDINCQRVTQSTRDDTAGLCNQVLLYQSFNAYFCRVFTVECIG